MSLEDYDEVEDEYGDDEPQTWVGHKFQTGRRHVKQHAPWYVAGTGAAGGVVGVIVAIIFALQQLGVIPAPEASSGSSDEDQRQIIRDVHEELHDLEDRVLALEIKSR